MLWKTAFILSGAFVWVPFTRGDLVDFSPQRNSIYPEVVLTATVKTMPPFSAVSLNNSRTDSARDAGLGQEKRDDIGIAIEDLDFDMTGLRTEYESFAAPSQAEETSFSGTTLNYVWSAELQVRPPHRKKDEHRSLEWTEDEIDEIFDSSAVGIGVPEPIGSAATTWSFVISVGLWIRRCRYNGVARKDNGALRRSNPSPCCT